MPLSNDRGGGLKKILFCIMLFSPFLNAADISSLPSSIVLQPNDDIKDTALSQKGNGLATTFNYNVFSNFSISGAGQYTLTVNDTTTTFYANSFTVGQNTKFALMSFHTVAFNGNLILGENSVFSIISSSNTLAGGDFSDFGGESKVTFYKRDAKVILGANSSATFSQNVLFINYAQMTLNQGASLKIDATKAIRFGNEFTNNGASVTLTGKVYNVGYSGNIWENSVSNFVVNSGTVSITDDFYNGANSNEVEVDSTGGGGILNPFDPPYGGGGNLIINGGTVSITGNLISKKGGYSVQGGSVNNPQNSSIGIYGGTLEVNGALQNKEGSTLSFGIGNNGTMGLLKGNLENDKGQVAVNIKNIELNKEYTFIQGTITGLNDNELAIVGSNSQFLDHSYKDGKITVSEKTNADGTTKFDEHKQTLNTNEKGILNTIEQKIGRSAILTGDLDIDSTINTADESIKESYISNPANMLNVLQSNAVFVPTQKSASLFARTAATEIIRFDNGKRIESYQKAAEPQRNFYFSPLGAILKAKNLKGYIAGFTLGTNYALEEYSSSFYLSYAYGSSSQDLDTQNTDTKGYLFQTGFLGNFSYNVLELATNANLSLGVFKINNQWQNMPSFDSDANFGNYQLNLGVLMGVKFGDKLSFKPFVGVQNYIEFQDAFQQSGGLGLKSDGYNAIIVDGVLGIKTHYVYDEFASFFAQFSFENRLLNTHKEVFMRTALNDELKYENKSYDNILSLNLGTQILTYHRIKLNAELLYKYYNSGLNYLGASLLLKYSF